MRISIGNGFGMVAALFLSACMARHEPPPIEDFASWEDIVPQTTLIQIDPESGPVDLNTVLGSEEKLRRALDTLFPESANIENLGERIDRIREPSYERRSADSDDMERSPVLSGLGGVIANAFLDAAKATLDANGRFDRTKRVYEFVYGKIIAYEFDKDNGSGMFNTITYYTTVTIPAGPRPIISETDAYRWTINVPENGFTVVPRDNSDPDDPFPNTMEFSDAMLNRINFLGFQYKLWAEGKIIEIETVEYKAHGTSDYVVVPDTDWRYDQTDENCIDMLFVNYPAPMLGDLKPPLYCLGRCKTPQLINTNAD